MREMTSDVIWIWYSSHTNYVCISYERSGCKEKSAQLKPTQVTLGLKATNKRTLACKQLYNPSTLIFLISQAKCLLMTTLIFLNSVCYYLELHDLIVSYSRVQFY